MDRKDNRVDSKIEYSNLPQCNSNSKQPSFQSPQTGQKSFNLVVKQNISEFETPPCKKRLGDQYKSKKYSDLSVFKLLPNQFYEEKVDSEHKIENTISDEDFFIRLKTLGKLSQSIINNNFSFKKWKLQKSLQNWKIDSDSWDQVIQIHLVAQQYFKRNMKKQNNKNISIGQYISDLENQYEIYEKPFSYIKLYTLFRICDFFKIEDCFDQKQDLYTQEQKYNSKIKKLMLVNSIVNMFDNIINIKKLVKKETEKKQFRALLQLVSIRLFPVLFPNYKSDFEIGLFFPFHGIELEYIRQVELSKEIEDTLQIIFSKCEPFKDFMRKFIINLHIERQKQEGYKESDIKQFWNDDSNLVLQLQNVHEFCKKNMYFMDENYLFKQFNSLAQTMGSKIIIIDNQYQKNEEFDSHKILFIVVYLHEFQHIFQRVAFSDGHFIQNRTPNKYKDFTNEKQESGEYFEKKMFKFDNVFTVNAFLIDYLEDQKKDNELYQNLRDTNSFDSIIEAYVSRKDHIQDENLEQNEKLRRIKSLQQQTYHRCCMYPY